MNDTVRKDRVLVVDDQPMNVKLLATRLIAAGYEVLTAYNGEEALDIVAQSAPDIILLDIMMPGLDGYEVTERLRKNPFTSTIPIVLVTALEGIDDKVRGLNSGADDFLTKPVNHVELLARVRSLVKLKKLQDQLLKKSSAPRYDAGRGEGGPEGKQLVMIVDDDEEAANNLGLILSSAEYDVISEQSGRGANDLLSHALPDLILLDLMLPDVSGIELLRKWRANGDMQNVPVIILSAIADLEAKVKGIETGADDYLVKPVNSIELIARIRSNLHKYEVQRTLQAGAKRFFNEAVTDSLTGLYNRKYLQMVLEREIASFQRYGMQFSFLMLDIDHFKTVNDVFGHPAGDGVLKDLGAILREQKRRSDLAARYGGEEFAVLLDHTTMQGALAAAENLRKAIEEHRFPGIGDKQVTVSIGVSECSADDDEQSIIKRADDALFMAKEGGRNSVAGS